MMATPLARSIDWTVGGGGLCVCWGVITSLYFETPQGKLPQHARRLVALLPRPPLDAEQFAVVEEGAVMRLVEEGEEDGEPWLPRDVAHEERREGREGGKAGGETTAADEGREAEEGAEERGMGGEGGVGARGAYEPEAGLEGYEPEAGLMEPMNLDMGFGVGMEMGGDGLGMGGEGRGAVGEEGVEATQPVEGAQEGVERREVEAAGPGGKTGEAEEAAAGREAGEAGAAETAAAEAAAGLDGAERQAGGARAEAEAEAEGGAGKEGEEVPEVEVRRAEAVPADHAERTLEAAEAAAAAAGGAAGVGEGKGSVPGTPRADVVEEGEGRGGGGERGEAGEAGRMGGMVTPGGSMGFATPSVGIPVAITAVPFLCVSAFRVESTQTVLDSPTLSSAFPLRPTPPSTSTIRRQLISPDDLVSKRLTIRQQLISPDDLVRKRRRAPHTPVQLAALHWSVAGVEGLQEPAVAQTVAPAVAGDVAGGVAGVSDGGTADGMAYAFVADGFAHDVAGVTATAAAAHDGGAVAEGEEGVGLGSFLARFFSEAPPSLPRRPGERGTGRKRGREESVGGEGEEEREEGVGVGRDKGEGRGVERRRGEEEVERAGDVEAGVGREEEAGAGREEVEVEEVEEVRGQVEGERLATDGEGVTDEIREAGQETAAEPAADHGAGAAARGTPAQVSPDEEEEGAGWVMRPHTTPDSAAAGLEGMPAVPPTPFTPGSPPAPLSPVAPLSPAASGEGVAAGAEAEAASGAETAAGGAEAGAEADAEAAPEPFPAAGFTPSTEPYFPPADAGLMEGPEEEGASEEEREGSGEAMAEDRGREAAAAEGRGREATLAAFSNFPLFCGSNLTWWVFDAVVFPSLFPLFSRILCLQLHVSEENFYFLRDGGDKEVDEWEPLGSGKRKPATAEGPPTDDFASWSWRTRWAGVGRGGEGGK
ncbi:unnamed protein product [Closterium sp. NIES-54]